MSNIHPFNEAKERSEQPQKPKVLVLLGRDIQRLVDHLPELKQEIMRKDPNRQVINNKLERIKPEDISDDPCNIVSIYAHGNADAMQSTQGQKKFKMAFSGLIEGQTLTIGNLLHIQSKKHNNHFDILGCYQGAVIQDIERNVERFEVGTTFTIHAPAQYSTSSDNGNPILLDQLKQYSAGETEQAKLFGKYSKQTAETLFFIKIVKGVDGKNTLIAFKAIAPKHAEDAKVLEEFTKREAIYQFGNKAHQHANLVTLAGADHPEYQALHDAIAAERLATPLSDNYLHQTLALHKRRGRARRNNATKGENYKKSTSDKGPLAEILLKQYQDIPDAVAKSYDSIFIIKDEFLGVKDRFPERYANIVEYAMFHDQTIGGQHPLIWAIEKNVKIREEHPLVWAIANDKMIGAEPVLEWAVRTGQTIGDKSALEFAIKENKKFGAKSAIEWALEHDINFAGQPVLEWAIHNNIKIGELSAVEYAVVHDMVIVGQAALDWLIDHYRTRLFLDDLTSKSYVLQYEEDGQSCVKKIPALYFINKMASKAIKKEATIDGLQVDEWIKNYQTLFTQHRIFGKTPVEYAIEQGKKIKGFDTIDIPQIYNIKAIEAAIESGNLSKLKAALDLDPNARDKLHNTPLAYARMLKKPQAVRALLALGADPNLTDAYGQTELSRAVLTGAVEIVRALLESPRLKELNNDYGAELLCEASNAEVVELLLQHKADPNRQSVKGDTPLKNAIFTGNLPLIHALLKGGAKLDEPDDHGIVLLHEAIFLGKNDIVEALLEAGANPHKAKPHKPDDEILKELAIQAKNNPPSSPLPADYFVDDNIEFPICLAARCRNSKIISLLADKSVDLNQWGAVDGKTPLSIALDRMSHSCSYSEKELQETFDTIKTLLECGADLKVLNKDGSSLLSMLRFTGSNIKIKNAALDLLINNGANLDAVGEDGVSLLQSAVASSDVRLIEKLLAHNANPNTKDIKGNSPLSIALSMYKNSPSCYDDNPNRNVEKIVKLLIKYGANPNIQDKHAVSALQMSASFNDPALMHILLQAKADPNTQDEDGNSPLSCLVDRAIAKITTYDYDGFNMEIDRLKAFLENPSTDPNILRKIGTSQIEYVLDSIAYNHYSSSSANRRKLIQTLIEAPRVNANLLNKHGVRLLNTVINKGDYESVNLILKKANPNLPDLDGTTPLQHAIRQNNPKFVNLLHEAVSNPPLTLHYKVGLKNQKDNEPKDDKPQDGSSNVQKPG